MLFVAPEFLLVFLPATLLVYWGLETWKGGRWSMGWLLLASLIFYGWSGWDTLALFLASLMTNFSLGKWIARSSTRLPLTVGVGLNLALLALFKYTNFGLESLQRITGLDLPHVDWALPLAISFYTFQQIAFLVQCHRSRQAEIPWRDYALAVAFFPHLIAGPLVHYRDLVPQFHSLKRRRVAAQHLYEGISMFVIALAKKLLIADSLSRIATPLFLQAQAGQALTTSEAWMAALAYTFQIYFDFSAYSEMAMGLALMFGLRLPVNFRRPYAAVDLRDFWKRWHITLSEFLRDYLYIPLGGNRKGAWRRWLNLFLTMLLGGLWHGASWAFVLWGGLHGLFLAVNHAWATYSPVRLPKYVARMLTFTLVVMLWVPFRAETWEATSAIWKTMVGAGEAVVAREEPPSTTLGYTLAIVERHRSASGDAALWSLLAQPETLQWVTLGLTAILVFACRSNLALSIPARAGTLGRAVFLGLLIFAVVARSFQAPPGEFIYFRF